MVGKYVIKKGGGVEIFSEEKIINSMNRVGVPASLQPQVLAHVRQKFTGDYITAQDLFKHILEYLKPRDQKASLRLNLRRAIFDLGPTGFPFEKYLAKIFQDQGYKTEVDLHLPGTCVIHEIDVLIQKEGKKEVVEAKFHNGFGVVTDVQVALYTYARFLDIKDKNNISGVWLITNTKLSLDAITYAKCKNMNVLAWNYPSGASLQDFVEKPRMYPVTILSDLTGQEKIRLIEDNIILCRDLLALSEKELESFPLVKKGRLTRAIQSARLLVGDS